MNKRVATSNKRVGASVVPNAQVSPFPQYGVPPPFPVPGIGIPNPCGVPPQFPLPIPFPPFLPYPIVFDDRVPPFPPEPAPVPPVVQNVSITAEVAPQTVASSSTTVLMLSNAISSIGGARVSGSSIILPVRGTYTLSISVAASRALTSTGGNVMFILNGGIGSSFIASGNIASGESRIFTGSVTFSTNEVNTPISVLVNNEGGSLSILGGTVTVQLTSRL